MTEKDKREISMIMAETLLEFGERLCARAETHHNQTVEHGGHGGLHSMTVYLLLCNIGLAAQNTATAMQARS